MADQSVASEKPKAADEAPKTAAETPAKLAEAAKEVVKAEPAKAAPAPKVEPKAKAASAASAKAKRPARRASAKLVGTAGPAKAAKPARKTAKKLAVTAAIAVAAAKPVRAGLNRIKQGADTMNKQTRETVDSGLFAADQFKNVFGDVNERTKAAAERSAKIVEELADLTRGNVEAFVASSKIAAKGVEALSQDAAEYSRKSFEEVSTALKSFAEVKSATDFFKLQSDFARAAFDNAVAESARISENMLKIAGDVAEPITSRYTVAAERVKTLAA